MFWHNFRYALKIIFRERALVFWTFAFPLILATFFSLAFAQIDDNGRFAAAKVAVVNDSAWAQSEYFQEAFRVLGEEGEEQVFQIRYAETSEQAGKLLEDDEVAGHIQIIDAKPKVYAKANSADVTVIKLATEQIAEQARIVQEIGKNDPSKLGELVKAESAAQLKDESGEKVDHVVIEFYSLIAMTCLYGGMIGMVAMNHLLANMSASGKRIAVSPVSKAKLVLSNLLASYIVQLIGLGLLFIYTIFVLKVDYGARTGLVVLLALVGSLAGLAFGATLASVAKISENAKTGLIIAFTMLGCFLAGMMGITMKYVVDANAPLINQINPANLITDGLYTLYYYDTLGRFWRDILILGGMTIILYGVTTWSLRKQQYDSL